jgi:hypothetical protein
VWLFAIASRVAAEHRRRDARLHLDERAVVSFSRLDRSLELRRRVELLDRLLATLSDSQRAIFVMAEIEGFNAPEIAVVIGEKLNTVYLRLRLGRARFERALARHRGEHDEVVAEAQRALSGGAAARALGLIDQHSQRFPHGELAPERDAARVLALCALGRNAEAQRARQAFAHSWPDSPLGVRVAATCAPLHRARRQQSATP